jgi:hypothetical protein
MLSSFSIVKSVYFSVYFNTKLVYFSVNFNIRISLFFCLFIFYLIFIFFFHSSDEDDTQGPKYTRMEDDGMQDKERFARFQLLIH